MIIKTIQYNAVYSCVSPSHRRKGSRKASFLCYRGIKDDLKGLSFLFWYGSDPDGAGQISSREAEDVSTWKQNSFRSGARSFGHYATDYQYSCKKQHRAANHFPYGLGVHPLRVADLDGRICRIFEVQCQRVSEGGTSECKSILPSKAECEKTAKDDEDYYDCNDVSGCIKLHILFLLCFVFFADFVFYQGIEYLICGKRIPTEILPWIRS